MSAPTVQVEVQPAPLSRQQRRSQEREQARAALRMQQPPSRIEVREAYGMIAQRYVLLQQELQEVKNQVGQLQLTILALERALFEKGLVDRDLLDVKLNEILVEVRMRQEAKRTAETLIQDSKAVGHSA